MATIMGNYGERTLYLFKELPTSLYLTPEDLEDYGIGSAMDELEPDDRIASGLNPEGDSYQETVDSLFGESYEQETLEANVATLVRPSRIRTARQYDALSRPSISSGLGVSRASGDYRTFASRPTSCSSSKRTDDITWTRTLGIMALCAGLLFGLFSIVPSGRGPAVTTKPIEQVRVGQRVLVDAPEEALAADFARLTSTALFWDQGDGSWKLEAVADPMRDFDKATSEQITAADYRLVKLQARSVWPDGTVDTINVESLQPWQWIQRHEAHVGGYAPLPVDTHEIGVPEDLLGKVLDILPCPPMRAGPGRVVLTTVNHLNTDVVELTLRDSRGETETLRPTAIHLFYSTSHGEWIPASRLANGERLDGVDGKVTVVDVTRLPGTHRVYNMTVQGEHLYRVAECGVLVHNQYGDEATNIVSEIGIAGSGRKINVGAPKGLLNAPAKFRGLSNGALNRTIDGPQHALLRKLFDNKAAAGLTRESLEAASELSRRAILNSATSPAQKLVHQGRLRQLADALGKL